MPGAPEARVRVFAVRVLSFLVPSPHHRSPLSASALLTPPHLLIAYLSDLPQALRLSTREPDHARRC
ncbi:hypothetical protein PENSPDRAFT_652977 [Peniophora sp. CONT]|nr:hypothetical protein PENSPDRAFT_652977 [Peniophora sp. CONT]